MIWDALSIVVSYWKAFRRQYWYYDRYRGFATRLNKLETIEVTIDRHGQSISPNVERVRTIRPGRRNTGIGWGYAVGLRVWLLIKDERMH